MNIGIQPETQGKETDKVKQALAEAKIMYDVKLRKISPWREGQRLCMTRQGGRGVGKSALAHLQNFRLILPSRWQISDRMCRRWCVWKGSAAGSTVGFN